MTKLFPCDCDFMANPFGESLRVGVFNAHGHQLFGESANSLYASCEFARVNGHAIGCGF